MSRWFNLNIGWEKKAGSRRPVIICEFTPTYSFPSQPRESRVHDKHTGSRRPRHAGPDRPSCRTHHRRKAKPGRLRLSESYKRRPRESIDILSQNVRGLNEDKLQFLLKRANRRGTYAAAIQESWRLGSNVVQHYGFRLVTHGSSSTTSHRPNGGVAILLSKEAVRGWERANNEVLHFGERILAVRLTCTDAYGRPVRILLGSAYSPTGAAAPSARRDFFDNLDQFFAAGNADEMVVLGTDANAAMGRRTRDNDRVRGPFGLPQRNAAGMEWTQFLALRSLCLPTSFFKRRIYQTWTHPRSKKGYQLDQWCIKRAHLSRVRNAYRVGRQRGDSDHDPIVIRLRVCARLQRQRRSSTRTKKFNNSELCLQGEEGKKFRQEYANVVASSLSSSHCNFTDLTDAMVTAGEELLAEKKSRQPSWFEADLKNLLHLRQRRDDHVEAYQFSQSNRNRQAATVAWRALRRAVKRAKNNWIEERVSLLNVSREPGTRVPPAELWNFIFQLQKGMGTARKVHAVKLRRPDGTMCDSSKESAEVFRTFFEKLYNVPPKVDPRAVERIEQRPILDEMDVPPSDLEIKAVIRKMKNGKASGESGIAPEQIKALLDGSETASYLFKATRNWWCSEGRETPKEWLVGRLKVLPKSGDLSNPGRWRGITLLEVFSKMVASILCNRMNLLIDSIGLEAQCGFRHGRGCADAIFSLKIVLHKLREFGRKSWGVFIDLVKAFDSVPRENLFLILERYGTPARVVNLIRALYTGTTTRLSIGEAVVEFLTTTGVKQGDNLAPVLFIIYMQAALESAPKKLHGITFRYWDDPIKEASKKAKKHNAVCRGKTPCFCSKCGWRGDGLAWSAKSTRKTGFKEATIDMSLYADDAAIIASNRSEAKEDTITTDRALTSFGLDMHRGRNGKKSKTECVYFKGKETSNATATADIEVDDGSIHFSSKFCYLGSVVDEDLCDSTDVKVRIQKATAAFEAMQKGILCSKDINPSLRGTIFIILVVTILLYGSECWSLLVSDRILLRSFYRKCVRRICRVSMHEVKKYRIKHSVLLRRLCLLPLHEYISRRRLRWLGHVCRMKPDRLPRQLLFSWLPSSRPKGRPFQTYGHSIKRDLEDAFKVCKESTRSRILAIGWIGLTQHRKEWREFIDPEGKCYAEHK